VITYVPQRALELRQENSSAADERLE